MNFSLKIRPLLTLLGLGLLAGCGPKAGNFSILPAGQYAVQSSTANNKVDILWVIDNSGSMLTKQQNLAASFDSFTQVFLDKNFDFHMAIVTTDTRDIASGGQAGIFQGAPSVITQNTANFSLTFQSNVVVGSFGDAAAKGLDATILALSPGLLSADNANFLRSDAHLAVIYVSDADDDDSTASTTDVMAYLQNLKPDVYDVISQTYKKNFTASAVVVDTSNPSNAACALPFEDGVKFKTLANATNGSIASICENDFASGLVNISQSIAAAITMIPLARAPQVSTIVVTFDGVVLAQDATNGWTYSSSEQAVRFHGTAIPQANTAISVNYIPSDIIR